MKKRSIGAKIFSVLVILGVIFGLGIVANIAALQAIDKNNERILSIYLQMQIVEGRLDSKFQQTQLYGNLVYTKQGTDEQENMKEKLGAALSELDSRMEQLTQTVAASGNAELISLCEDLAGVEKTYSEYMAQILAAAEANDYDTAGKLVDNILAYRTPVAEKLEAFSGLSLTAVSDLGTHSDTKINGTITFNT